MRQNIDEKWKEDPRKKALAKRIGERNANGMRVEINWLLLDYKGQPIPLKVFQFVENHEDWVECGLASIEGDSVVVAGADEYAAFFDKQKENGQKGGRPKQTQENPEKPKRKKQNPKKPSSSSSFSSSVSSSLEEGNTLQPAVAVAEKTPVVHYCDEYKARYGHSPVVGGKQAGLLSTFAKNHPSRWQDLIRGYLQLPDSWLIQRSHPVESLEQKVNEIERFLKSGKIVTRKVAEHLEDAVDKAQGTNRRPRKSAEELARERDPNYVPGSEPARLAGGES